ncbi:MAG TPA: DedA family protein [Candidatus Paceibacterota bacterium]|nr:DedA family protein [Candidatus Paceibacterota bacterium]
MAALISHYPIIAQFVAFLEAAKYPLFFAGSYLEGTVVMLTGGVLLRLGEVSFLPLYVSLMAGDILSDIMWYWVGYLGARPFMMRWGYLVNATPGVIAKLEDRFHKYHLHILVISKLTMGFGLAVPILTTAGMLRVSFMRYLIINVVGSFVWVAAVIFVGYTFGNILAAIPEDFQIGFFFAMIAVFFFGLRYLNSRLEHVNW